jgi:hypothetical protein
MPTLVPIRCKSCGEWLDERRFLVVARRRGPSLTYLLRVDEDGNRCRACAELLAHHLSQDGTPVDIELPTV